jgi:two-component system, response regulator YesN
MIKVLIISVDQTIKFFVEKNYDDPKYQFITFSSTKDPLDIMSQICSINPSILILDDDFINPNSVHLLGAIKKVNPKLSIIFLTSNTSLDIGRKINSIGVKYYIMKPITDKEFQEFLKSVNKQLNEKIY